MNAFLLICINSQAQHLIRVSHIEHITFNEITRDIIFYVSPVHGDNVTETMFIEHHGTIEGFIFRRRWLKSFLNQERP